MSSTPERRGRLAALHLVGFKSFAERTTIEFGPGISAVVGPNGSGKSNLADALRWTLGEQGRQLRTRRAEDVIFAGSSARRAIGMADVTLVLDNNDGLLPLDFSEVEVSRRLYRSGESDYLLNRQRIRLRDLVDVLDAGNLADNAFLFIGQGMVDQALALRPEERRPLFEEAAGVRRHERRRRRAETELEEATANLDRVDDLLAELRPQARRLAAQAEQLRARRSAGHDLAEALIRAAHARWFEASSTASAHQLRLEEARTAADRALAELRAAEATAEQLSSALDARAEAERGARARLETQRNDTTELRLTEARLAAELAAAEREQARLTGELDTSRQRLAEARRRLALPLPEIDQSLRAQLDELDAAIDKGDSSSELAELRRRLSAGQRQLVDARAAAAAAEQQLAAHRSAIAAVEQERARAQAELAAASEAEAAAQTHTETAISTLETARTRHAAARHAAAVAEGEVAAARARLAMLEASFSEQDDDELWRAARARGAQRVAEGLEIEAHLRRAVEAALDSALRAVAAGTTDALAMRERQGTVVLADGLPARSQRDARPPDDLLAAAGAAGGGRLADAIMRDPGGHVGRLLARCVWLPSLEAALELWPRLPIGWRAVTMAGEVLDHDGVLRLAAAGSLLDQRAARDEQAQTAERLESHTATLRAALDEARAAEHAAAAAADSARQAVDGARRRRRLAEEGDQAAARRVERATRESDWLQQQLDNLGGSVEAHAAGAAATEARIAALEATGAGKADRADRRLDLQHRRAELAERHASDELRLERARSERQRAEVTIAVDEARIGELDDAHASLAVRRADLASERERAMGRLAAASELETAERTALEQLVDAGGRERVALLTAERGATAARERLRAAENASRGAELAAVEARLQLEQVREGLLVELAGIGADALVVLAGDGATADVGLEALVDAASRLWASAPPAEPAPPAGRLSALRRNFTELGAGNPFAAEEYEAVHARLDEIETQRADLASAMDATRQLIGNLEVLINEQFRTTFTALEGAFARRFEQLFGGGEAQLLLTAPDDIATTGVEITARPPGKKRQPLGMLSGGERALTAVALLLAMLEVRPVPFCVLDEVDAALDEANVGRFAAALRGLADRTQFIVITHNRGTIEAADALYGVTLGEDAVSRVVSLRLPPPNGNGPRSADAESATDLLTEPALP